METMQCTSSLLLYVSVGMNVWRSGDNTGDVGSVFPSCRPRGLNSGCQAWQQASSSTLSHLSGPCTVTYLLGFFCFLFFFVKFYFHSKFSIAYIMDVFLDCQIVIFFLVSFYFLLCFSYFSVLYCFYF